MSSDEHLYLDVLDLYGRGWTETLIRRFLGEPDWWKAVDHWKNYTGKRAYFLERVEAAEASAEFEAAYRASLKRRKIDPAEAAAFLVVREETAGAVQAWRKRLSPEDIRTRGILDAAARELQAARERGYRTPHRG
jgi:hypothetical protein